MIGNDMYVWIEGKHKVKYNFSLPYNNRSYTTSKPRWC